MIAIIDYKSGNVRSVANALKRLGAEAVITDDVEIIRSADKVIFPGVGEASSAMQQLQNKGLDSLIPTLTQPVLGICLGMQLLCTHSEEGNTAGLGVFPTKVKRFPAEKRVPHMGWNNLIATAESTLCNTVKAADDVYFVHSFYVECNAFTVAKSDYILPFSAALQRANFYAVQFHPEKSGEVGERILQNFLKLN